MRLRVATQTVTVILMMTSLNVQKKQKKWLKQEQAKGNIAFDEDF